MSAETRRTMVFKSLALLMRPRGAPTVPSAEAVKQMQAAYGDFSGFADLSLGSVPCNVTATVGYVAAAVARSVVATQGQLNHARAGHAAGPPVPSDATLLQLHVHNALPRQLRSALLRCLEAAGEDPAALAAAE